MTKRKTKDFFTRQRVVIESVSPAIDCGKFPVKRVEDDILEIEADAFTDGHDSIRVVAHYLPPRGRKWREVPMRPVGNDRWQASIELDKLGVWSYRVAGWVDRFLGWYNDLPKRIEAGQDLEIQFLVAAELIDRAIESSEPDEKSLKELEKWKAELRDDSLSQTTTAERILAGELPDLMTRFSDRRHLTQSSVFEVMVDRERAAFSAWYEMFPRSTGDEGEHGTFRTAESMLPYVRGMGFDVLYLPPIHPVGTSFRKGKNNALKAEPGDVGSPWAIGSTDGGHTSIHPELGSFDDFERFREKAADHDLEIALDIAFQVSPDHPWVTEHPEWFRSLPDGSIQYAENPPKKYQDIYPIDFESDDYRELWEALRDVFLFWIERGVKIFRVDNPHTKAFRFWEWAIPSIRELHPDAIFLSEAFTRPKIMYRLAKGGFTQSYTYFTWRAHKGEMEEYMRELTRTEAAEFFRPNFWPNTPDILHETLQKGGRPMFMSRLLLASMLSSNYGIYGPPFELMEHLPREEGSEEYLHSEKYELRSWDLDRPDSLRHFIRRVNTIRRENRALQRNESLRFHEFTSDQITVFSKKADDNVILCAISFDPYHRQEGVTRLDLGALGLESDERFEVHDLLTDARYVWQGSENFIRLDPDVVPAHVFSVRRASHGSEATLDE